MSDTHEPDDDTIDGCDIDFAEHAITDDDEPFVALFAGVPEDEIEAHAEALREVLGS